MIISRNWLNEFIELSSISTEQICKTLNGIGLEVDGCTKISVPAKVVVGHIIECEKHPDAAKLNICKINVGEQEPLQIVCGASNARADIYTAVALIGAELKDMKIEKAKLRGVESFGMCCSSTELGLPKINEGIIELDSSIGELIPGAELSNFSIFNDELIEIELTPNRGDCLSLHGIARDLGAALDINLRQKEEFKDAENAIGIRRIMSVHFADSLNSSFCFKAAYDEQNHFEAPLLVQLRLAMADKLLANGAKNHLAYATHATGVLFGALDIDKLCPDCEQFGLQVRTLEDGESEIVCNNKQVAIASVLTNAEFEADSSTSKLLIMAQYTHPQVIAECHKKYKNADIYHSFRGSEPELELGLNYLCSRLNAQILGGNCSNVKASEKHSISFTIGELERLIGQTCEKNDVVKILKRLGFELSFADDNIYVKVPHFRHDISNSADICEEIVRIIGIDNIASRPLEFYEANRTNAVINNYYKAKKMRDFAVSRGYFESVGYIFDSKEFLDKIGLKCFKNEIVNPITAELNTLRPAIFSTLLKHIKFNQANGKKCIKLFEIGEVFTDSQHTHLCMVASGASTLASIRNGAKPKEVNFFDFLSDIRCVIGAFELKSCENPLLSEYERADVYINHRKIGEVGRLALELEDELDLAKTYIFECDFGAINYEPVRAKIYSKLPGTSRDLSLLVPKRYDYSLIKNCINSLNIATLKDFKISDLYQDESLGEFESLTINFEFNDLYRPLKNDDVNAEMQEILDKLLALGLKQR